MQRVKFGSFLVVATAVAASIAGCTSNPGSAQAIGQASDTRTATLFSGARVIVGDGTTTIENAAFVVEGNRITSIGRTGEVQAPSNATRVDLSGKTVMPAMLDLHSHLGYENTATNKEDETYFTRQNVIDHLERFAYTGHALTHSLGNDNPEVFDARYAADAATFVDLRVESQQDSFTGARYYTIGRGLAWEGTGNPRSSAPYPIFKPLQARLAVRELHAQGIKFAKLWLEDRGGYQIPDQKGPFVLTQESYTAAIEEAHRLGMRTIAHVKTLADTKAMIRAGLDIQTHPIQDVAVDAELIALVKARPEFLGDPGHYTGGTGRQRSARTRRAAGLAAGPDASCRQVRGRSRSVGSVVRDQQARADCYRKSDRREHRRALQGRCAHGAWQPRRRWHPSPRMGEPHGARGLRELGRHDSAPGDRRGHERRGQALRDRGQPRNARGRQGSGLHRARREPAR